MTIAVVVVASAGCGGTRYHATRGARLVHFTLHSKLTHRDLHGHDLKLWDAYMPKFLRFFARGCA